MEDVDRMIIDAFAKLKWSTFCALTLFSASHLCSSFLDKDDDDGCGENGEPRPSPPSNLAQLGTADVVEAAVRALWRIDPRTRDTIPSYRLPAHTAGRFKMATTLSNAIKVDSLFPSKL